MTNLVPLNSSQSKEFIDTKIIKIGQVWDKNKKLWALSQGWFSFPQSPINFWRHITEFKKLQLGI
jgi:predicted nucleic acid-binding protein